MFPVLPSRGDCVAIGWLCAAFAGGELMAQGTPNFLTAEERAAGWRLLFDGKTPTGLRGLQKPDFLKAGWKVEEEALTLPKSIEQAGKVTGGDLATTEVFLDFEFSWEYRLAVSGDSGVLYFARAGAGGKPTGCEFQLIDDVHHPDGLKGGPIRRTGALYSVLRPGDNVRFNSQGWNEGRLVVLGNRVEHWVNREKVLTYDLGSPALFAAMRASKIRFAPGFGTKSRTSIVLLDQGEDIAFRSLKVRTLPQAAPATPVPVATPVAVAATPPPAMPAATPLPAPPTKTALAPAPHVQTAPPPGEMPPTPAAATPPPAPSRPDIPGL